MQFKSNLNYKKNNEIVRALLIHLPQINRSNFP
jgi:hypothetical protein